MDKVTEHLAASADFAPHLKAAMRRMPSAVSIITTRQPEAGSPMGLVASAVIPISMEPASMLVSINRSATAHPTIAMAELFCVNVLGVDQYRLVELFSSPTMRDRRFAGDLWEDRCGLPGLRDAVASICCQVEHRVEYGTHEIFIGKVTGIALNEQAEPLAWVEGSLARIVAFQPDA